MKHSLAINVIAVASSITMILLSALLGIVLAFMVETRNQTVAVENVRQGDVTWNCLVLRSGNRIEDMSCERLEAWQG